MRFRTEGYNQDGTIVIVFERTMLVYQSPSKSKPAWMRFLEWLILYVLVGLFAFGLEHKVTGEIHHQGWEFYTVTLCLFLVFALPGFIYRYDLKKHLDRIKRHRGSGSGARSSE